MAPEKRNKFLDAEDSEDDDQSQGYDSDLEVRKGSSRTAKRRKLDDARDDDDDASSSDDEPLTDDDETSRTHAARKGAADDNDDEDDDDPSSGAKTTKKSKKKLPELANPSDPLRGLVKKNLVSTDAAIKKSGVLYISRIPPFMKPHKLRTLLEPMGTINRTYLAPEDPKSHARRVRAGGNKKKIFTEGWVEFVDKRDAKRAHELLNARPIGGKKGSYYRDDVWSLVYLKGFKWRDLSAQIERENAERESRMRAEISKATKENLEFVRNVEQAKELDGIKAKRARQGKGDKAAEGGGGPARTFKQVPQVAKKSGSEQADSVKRVLSKIF